MLNTDYTRKSCGTRPRCAILVPMICSLMGFYSTPLPVQANKCEIVIHATLSLNAGFLMSSKPLQNAQNTPFPTDPPRGLRFLITRPQSKYVLTLQFRAPFSPHNATLTCKPPGVTRRDVTLFWSWGLTVQGLVTLTGPCPHTQQLAPSIRSPMP